MMENNVVTLETAKKLKAAGFKINPILWWVKMSGSAWRVTSMGIGESNRYAAPTAQEIADQLPDHGSMYRITRVALDSYVTYNFDDNRADRPSGDGQTMAEALAALWLKLRVAE